MGMSCILSLKHNYKKECFALVPAKSMPLKHFTFETANYTLNKLVMGITILPPLYSKVLHLGNHWSKISSFYFGLENKVFWKPTTLPKDSHIPLSLGKSP